jgi:hypothetical protein
MFGKRKETLHFYFAESKRRMEKTCIEESERVRKKEKG